MSGALDIVTVEEAASALRLGQTDVELYPELERIITSASHLIDTHFGAVIKRTVVETVYGARYSAQFLTKVQPIASITSITSDGETIDPAQYYVDDQQRVRRRWSHWSPYEPDGLQITYVAGRLATVADTGPVAAHFKQGCILQIQHMFRPYQHSTGVVNEFDTAVLAANTQGLARGVEEHFIGYSTIGIA